MTRDEIETRLERMYRTLARLKSADARERVILRTLSSLARELETRGNDGAQPRTAVARKAVFSTLTPKGRRR